MMSVSKNRKNKYDLFEVIFSGINNLGNTVVFCISLFDIKSKETYHMIFQTFFNKLFIYKIASPSVFVVPLEEGAIEAIQAMNKQIKIISN